MSDQQYPVRPAQPALQPPASTDIATSDDHIDEQHNQEPSTGRKMNGSATKRYNLNVPVELYDELQELAERRHTTVVDLLRRFIKLGLYATRVADDPDAALIIRERGTDREILLF